MKPCFIFSAGPRSGSTLLQRLVTSGHDVLIWGEGGGALNHAMQSLHLLDLSLQPASENCGGNGAEHFRRFLAGKDEAIPWIANMNPPIQHIVKTYRQMFDHLYGVPARAHGYARWGVKEVRSTNFTIQMLRTVFPEAKFVFLIRHPLACLRSIKQRNYRFLNNWGRRVSNEPLLHYARNWANLAETYAADKQGFCLRYEDLTAGDYSTAALCEYLEIAPIDPRFIAESYPDWPAQSPHLTLSDNEIAAVMPVLCDAMKQWNYD